MKFIDLFSGIGGFRFGMEQAGHECVGHIEIDKFANQSYAAIHKPREDEFFHDDITTIGEDELQNIKQRGIDIITGGFPCQAFSIAGLRKGFDDTRGTLFFDIARLAKEIQPKYLLLENVRGLLSHNSGNTFEVILRTLDEIGYDAEWQVLNSKHFGVPQNRERVFIVGHLRGSGGRKVFPITGDGRQVNDEFKINQIGNLIDTDSFGGNPQRGRVYGIDGIGPCLNTMGGGGLGPKIAININRGKISRRKDNTSTNIDANYHKGLDNHGARTGVVDNPVTGNLRIRKLTPKECWRLQGFPDWAFDRAKASGVSNSQLYKQAGNSVTVNVIEAIGRKLVIENHS